MCCSFFYDSCAAPSSMTYVLLLFQLLVRCSFFYDLCWRTGMQLEVDCPRPASRPCLHEHTHTCPLTSCAALAAPVPALLTGTVHSEQACLHMPKHTCPLTFCAAPVPALPTGVQAEMDCPSPARNSCRPACPPPPPTCPLKPSCSWTSPHGCCCRKTP